MSVGCRHRRAMLVAPPALTIDRSNSCCQWPSKYHVHGLCHRHKIAPFAECMHRLTAAGDTKIGIVHFAAVTCIMQQDGKINENYIYLCNIHTQRFVFGVRAAMMSPLCMPSQMLPAPQSNRLRSIAHTHAHIHHRHKAMPRHTAMCI